MEKAISLTIKMSWWTSEPSTPICKWKKIASTQRWKWWWRWNRLYIRCTRSVNAANVPLFLVQGPLSTTHLQLRFGIECAPSQRSHREPFWQSWPLFTWPCQKSLILRTRGRQMQGFVFIPLLCCPDLHAWGFVFYLFVCLFALFFLALCCFSCLSLEHNLQSGMVTPPALFFSLSIALALEFWFHWICRLCCDVNLCLRHKLASKY